MTTFSALRGSSGGMTSTQIAGGVLLLVIGVVLLATVGPNAAVLVALGLAVALFIAGISRQRT